MIAGTIIGGTAAETLVFRGLGPSLATDRLGISDPLPNPMLQLVNSQGTTLFTNADWQDTQAAEITAAGLAPTNPLAAGIRQPCSGSYTALLFDALGATGIGLLEIHNITSSQPVRRK